MKVKNFATGQASLDTGWGLIFRLNTLFNKAEDASLSGDFDKWNFVLDRIFVNLSYKGPMIIEFQEHEPNEDPIKVIDIKLSKEDIMVFERFKEMIRDVKNKKLEAIKKRLRRSYELAKEEHYLILLTKDIWLRKVMTERGLYLKEFQFDPTKAMWGG